jgi:cell wall-associated NlpC family hydrolase
VAPVRAEPDDASEQVTQALRGEPLEVEAIEGAWARIRTAYDYPGWIRAEALSNSLSLEAWLAPTAAEPVEAARSYLGTRYEWGGMTERGIDCSGLVHMAYRATGRLVPRDAHQQEAAAQPLREDGAERGDLVCFGEPGHAHHIAFWLGGGQILHSTQREGVDGVVEEPLENALAAGPIRFARL